MSEWPYRTDRPATRYACEYLHDRGSRQRQRGTRCSMPAERRPGGTYLCWRHWQAVSDGRPAKVDSDVVRRLRDRLDPGPLSVDADGRPAI